jgi:hypothetical protein
MDLADIRIRIAADEPELASALADVLIDCVEGGASVSFMWPLPLPKAIAFWQSVIESARRSERVLLVAEEVASGAIVGTVQVVFAIPENQPHRADVAKMLVHRRARRRGPTLRPPRMAALRRDPRFCAFPARRPVRHHLLLQAIDLEHHPLPFARERGCSVSA